MKLEQREQELAAIGASIGANCRPCIEHHIPAARAAGLSETELADAVATARAVQHEAVELLSGRVAELLGHNGATRAASVVLEQPSKTRELVALGASVGANSHALLHLHIGAALDAGLTPFEVKAALKMAGYVQHHAAELTAEEAERGLQERGGASAGAATS